MHEMGVQVCLVIGGGNIFRGVRRPRRAWTAPAADYMGMLATVMNALAMQSALERQGLQTRVQSAIPMTTVCEPYIRRRAIRHMEKGRVGDLRRGHRQSLLHHRYRRRAARRRNGLSTRMFKGTQVDGVYCADPQARTRTPSATIRSTYMDVLSRDLQVMDASAISLARENRIPIVVFLHSQARRVRGTMRGQGTVHHHQRTRAERMTSRPQGTRDSACRAPWTR